MAEEKLIDEFCKVTGTNVSRARFYLESAGWDSNLAMSSYFEEAFDEAENTPDLIPKPVETKQGLPPNASRIATFASLLNNEDKSDEEEGQAFYAGGSERSGQQVLGPSKRKAGNNIAEEVFKAIRSQDAEVFEPSKSQHGPTKLKAFCGTGHILGSSSENVVSNELNDSTPPPEINVRLWKSGFTVEDGPFRDYQDTQNMEFLEAIRKGEIPMELRRQAIGGIVNLNIEDHSREEYVPKKSAVKAFSGAGFRLGSITPPVVGSAQSSEEYQKNESDAQKTLNFDDSQPSTCLQIRLADGSRLTMKANYTHTIGDIRTYIIQARPEYSASVFSLMTSYPVRELTNDSATLEEANLLNTVIVQKLV